MSEFILGQKVRIREGVTGIGTSMQPGDEFLIDDVRNYTEMTIRINNKWWMRESELEPVPVTFQPGDIVRAEKSDEIIQGEIVQGVNEQYIAPLGRMANRIYLSDFVIKGYTLTLVRRPEPEIVLPTKPNALVYCHNKTWALSGGGGWYWAFGDWVSGVDAGKLLSWANRFDDYRVIFEGENE